MNLDKLNTELAQIIRSKGYQPVWGRVIDGSPSVLTDTTGGAPFGQEGTQFPGARLALRPPQSVKVFDVDHDYEGKHGMDTIDNAVDQLGPLPPTWRISARGPQNPSGRYLYRCPEDVEFNDAVFMPFGSLETREGKTKVFSDVEVVRTRHRFSWAPGTVHYKNDRLIEVYDENDESGALPSVDELPWLPQAWTDYLRNPPRSQSDVQFRPDPLLYGEGSNWHESVDSSSLSSRGQLCDFAFWMMASTRNDQDKVIEELKRVAVAVDPTDPWLDRDFHGMTDANTQRKTAEFNAKRDADYSPGTIQSVAVLSPVAQPASVVAPSPDVPPAPPVQYDEEEAGSWLSDSFTPVDVPLLEVAIEDVGKPELPLPPYYKHMPDSYKQEFARQAHNRQAKLDIEWGIRLQQGNEWKSRNDGRGGFTNPFDAPDPPAPETFTVVSAENGTTSLVTPNTVTVLYGNRASGKTWVAALWSRQEVTAGNHVMWLDFERQASLMKTKLKALGMPESKAKDQFHYSGGGLPPVDYLSDLIREYLLTSKRVLVVIDSFRDLLSAVVPSGDSNSGESIGKVYADYLDHLHNAGATICLIDHAPKSNTDSAFGSERKESAADTVLKVEMKEKFVLNHSGYSIITVTKDRYGVVPVDDAGKPRPAYLWVPANDDKPKGGGIRNYPDKPELRNWAPESEDGTVDDVKGRPKDADVMEFLSSGMATLDEIVSAMVNRDKERKKAARVWIRERTVVSNGIVAKAGDPMDRNNIKQYISQGGDHMVKRGVLVKDSSGNFEVARATPPPALTEGTRIEAASLFGDEDSKED